jgi:hypothetical protein
MGIFPRLSEKKPKTAGIASRGDDLLARRLYRNSFSDWIADQQIVDYYTRREHSELVEFSLKNNQK